MLEFFSHSLIFYSDGTFDFNGAFYLWSLCGNKLTLDWGVTTYNFTYNNGEFYGSFASYCYTLSPSGGVVFGCIDSTAINFNATATSNNGSCIYTYDIAQGLWFFDFTCDSTGIPMDLIKDFLPNSVNVEGEGETFVVSTEKVTTALDAFLERGTYPIFLANDTTFSLKVALSMNTSLAVILALYEVI